MEVLIGIICFVLGIIADIMIRRLLIKVNEINRKIELAERIISEENKRREFKEKYDFDLDEEQNQ